MNGFNLPPFFRYRLSAAVLLLFFAALPLLQAQYTPCATPPPTEPEMAEVAAAMANSNTANASS
ncbi:MAG: hypothetical protein KF734_17335, partial [Saprospiraceae bacterium]|nr:hypothetical protein [Saprospiraceae bacterium]